MSKRFGGFIVTDDEEDDRTDNDSPVELKLRAGSPKLTRMLPTTTPAATASVSTLSPRQAPMLTPYLQQSRQSQQQQQIPSKTQPLSQQSRQQQQQPQQQYQYQHQQSGSPRQRPSFRREDNTNTTTSNNNNNKRQQQDQKYINKPSLDVSNLLRSQSPPSSPPSQYQFHRQHSYSPQAGLSFSPPSPPSFTGSYQSGSPKQHSPATLLQEKANGILNKFYSDKKQGLDPETKALERFSATGILQSSEAEGKIKTFRYMMQTQTDSGINWESMNILYHVPSLVKTQPLEHYPIITSPSLNLILNIDLNYFSIDSKTNPGIVGSRRIKVICCPIFDTVNSTSLATLSRRKVVGYSCKIVEPLEKVNNPTPEKSICIHGNVCFEVEVFKNLGNILQLKPNNVMNDKDISELYYIDMRVGYQPTPKTFDPFSEFFTLSDNGMTSRNKDKDPPYSLYWMATIDAKYINFGY